MFRAHLVPGAKKVLFLRRGRGARRAAQMQLLVVLHVLTQRVERLRLGRVDEFVVHVRALRARQVVQARCGRRCSRVQLHVVQARRLKTTPSLHIGYMIQNTSKVGNDTEFPTYILHLYPKTKVHERKHSLNQKDDIALDQKDDIALDQRHKDGYFTYWRSPKGHLSIKMLIILISTRGQDFPNEGVATAAELAEP